MYILYCSYSGGFAPRISTVQNTQAHSEFLTTSIPKQKPRLHKNYLDPLVNEPPCLDFRLNKKIKIEKKNDNENEIGTDDAAAGAAASAAASREPTLKMKPNQG